MKKYIKIFLVIITIVNYNVSNFGFSKQIEEINTSGFDDDSIAYDDNEDNNSDTDFLFDKIDKLQNSNTLTEQLNNQNKTSNGLLQKINTLTSKEIYDIENNIFPLEKLDRITSTLNNKITEINHCISETFNRDRLSSNNNDSLFWSNIGKCQGIIVQLFNITEKILSSEIKDTKVILGSLLEFYLFVVNDIKRLSTEYLQYSNSTFTNIKSKFSGQKYNKQSFENLQVLIKDLNKYIDNYIIPELNNILPKNEKLTDQDIKIKDIVKKLNKLHNEIVQNKSTMEYNINLVFNADNANILKYRLKKQYEKLNNISKNIKNLTKGHIDINKQNEIYESFEIYRLCLENINTLFTLGYNLIINNISEEGKKCMANNSKLSTHWLTMFDKYIMNEDNRKLIENY